MTVMLSLGLPHSGFQKIHHLLTSVGLGEAKSSKNENFSPNEITEKLCEKYDCLNSEFSFIEQLNPGKMWHSLASDLMLSNLEQKDWGWSDSSSIYLLNFWKEFEPQLKFLLIYSSPQAYLSEYFINYNHEACEETARAALTSWKNYNTELLKFFLENKDRCVLMNIEAAMEQVADVIIILDEKFGCKLKFSSTSFLSSEGNLSCEKQLLFGQLSENLEIYNFYEELESCSDFPLYEDSVCHKKLYFMLNAIRKEKLEQQEITENLEKLKNKNLNLELELQKATNTVTYHLEEKKSHEQNLGQNNLEKENELLLLQLHQLQEELEVYYHKYQDLVSKGNEDKKVISGAGLLEKKETTIDMRHFIEGQNWYHAEDDGRWAGPDHVSSLKIPQLPKGTYELELNIVGAMSPQIVKQMKLLWNGVELPKKIIQPWSGGKAILRRYYLMLFQNREGGPLVLKTKLEMGVDKNLGDQFLGIQLPCTISPSSRGQNDTRDLGIKISEVKVIPV